MNKLSKEMIVEDFMGKEFIYFFVVDWLLDTGHCARYYVDMI